jgi:hypothetical protein
MKIVFSFFSCLNSSNPYYDNKDTLLDLLMVASFSAKKSGFRTCLVHDEFFSLPSEYRNAFNEIKIISKQEIYNMKLPNIAGGAIGKLICLKSINEPFIYLNPGVILYKDNIKKVIKGNPDCCFVYHEITPGFNKNLKEAITVQSKILGLDILKVVQHEVFRYTHIIGGNDYKLINNASDRLLQFIINNGDYLQKEILQNKSHYEKSISEHLIDLDSIIDNYWLPSYLSSENGSKGVSNLIKLEDKLNTLIKNIPTEAKVGTEINNMNPAEISSATSSLRQTVAVRIFNYKTGILFLPPLSTEEDTEKLKKIKHHQMSNAKSLSRSI